MVYNNYLQILVSQTCNAMYKVDLIITAIDCQKMFIIVLHNLCKYTTIQ